MSEFKPSSEISYPLNTAAGNPDVALNTIEQDGASLPRVFNPGDAKISSQADSLPEATDHAINTVGNIGVKHFEIIGEAQQRIRELNERARREGRPLNEDEARQMREIAKTLMARGKAD